MPVETTENYIRVRIRLPSEFQDGTFRTIWISKEKGINSVQGKLKDESSMTIQSFLFVKEKWTENNAVKWVKDHGHIPKFSNEFETKSFPFKIKQIDDDEGTFKGYASVFNNVDEGKDIVEPGAFSKTLQEQPELPILWSHDPWDLPIGIGGAEQDNHGLKVWGEFAREVQRAKDVWVLVKKKIIKGLSIGYKTIDSFKDDQNIRHLTELRLHEFSLCLFPMNELARVTNVKENFNLQVDIISDTDLQIELNLKEPVNATLSKNIVRPVSHHLHEIAAELKKLHADLKNYKRR